MLEKIRNFYKAYFDIGDRLGEEFYAVWMAVISIGLLNDGGQITPDHIGYVVAVALSVNFVWGIIDGVTAMLTNIIDRVQRDRLVYDLRTETEKAVVRALDDLDDTIAAALGPSEKKRIIEAIAAGSPGQNPRAAPYGPGKEDWLYALGTLTIDVVIVVPVVAPLVLLSDTQTAVYISRLIATAIFASIGAAYAHHLNSRRPWIAALVLGALGFGVFTAAYQTGW